MHIENDNYEKIKKLAKLGDPTAMMEMAEWHLDDRSVAIQWYKRAAERGIVKAMLELARLYAYDDRVQAIHWTEEAYKQGDDHAVGSIIKIYYEGAAYDEAHTWINKALEKDADDRDALYFLGMMYLGGHDVAQNYEQAISALEKSASAGHVSAMNALGYIYRDGIGVVPDKEKALQWYKQARDAGFGTAYVPYHRLQNQDPKVWVLNVIQDIVQEQSGIDRAEIQPDKSFISDLGMDSLDIVEIIMDVEKDFGTEIMDEEAEKTETIGNLYDLLLQRQQEGKLANETMSIDKINEITNVVWNDTY